MYRHLRPALPAVIALLCVAGCRSAPDEAHAAPAASEATSAPPAVEGASTAAATVAADPHESGPPWTTWDEGSARAQRENRPMMVFVHTDWCSQCRRLEPVFDRPDVLEAARDFVMISYNSDDNAAWIRTVVGNNDTYVPRVLFLRPNGTLQDLRSDHPRYPYFYTADMAERLKANLRAAQSGT